MERDHDLVYLEGYPTSIWFVYIILYFEQIFHDVSNTQTYTTRKRQKKESSPKFLNKHFVLSYEKEWLWYKMLLCMQLIMTYINNMVEYDSTYRRTSGTI